MRCSECSYAYVIFTAVHCHSSSLFLSADNLLCFSEIIHISDVGVKTITMANMNTATINGIASSKCNSDSWLSCCYELVWPEKWAQIYICEVHSILKGNFRLHNLFPFPFRHLELIIMLLSTQNQQFNYTSLILQLQKYILCRIAHLKFPVTSTQPCGQKY